MRGKVSDKGRLMHIMDAINFIERALHDKGEQAFLSDFILTTAVTKWIEIIGEAS